MLNHKDLTNNFKGTSMRALDWASFGVAHLGHALEGFQQRLPLVQRRRDAECIAHALHMKLISCLSSTWRTAEIQSLPPSVFMTIFDATSVHFNTCINSDIAVPCRDFVHVSEAFSTEWCVLMFYPLAFNKLLYQLRCRIIHALPVSCNVIAKPITAAASNI
ncbi:hypothetical protein VTP01DRAFT_7229 [Rhizomucor pusillus]|uniref:uncharacterized protein n=1 Tax=Rhizomucor pusillus TaxID=4840 RepID=UPI00374333EE